MAKPSARDRAPTNKLASQASSPKVMMRRHPRTSRERTMIEDGIATEQRGKILIITMDRPKVNAINHAVSRALYRAYHRLQNDPDLMVAILASANPRVFSAGWDLKEVADGEYR